jgi:hypothetical protein
MLGCLYIVQYYTFIFIVFVSAKAAFFHKETLFFSGNPFQILFLSKPFTHSQQVEEQPLTDVWATVVKKKNLFFPLKGTDSL